jgi:hypothetical protein
MTGTQDTDVVLFELVRPLTAALLSRAPFMAEGSRSRTYQEASDAPSWV